MTNIKTELTANQTQLLITAIGAEINKGRGTFLSDDDVYSLNQVMNNLRIRLNFAPELA